jgi:anti-sigma factor RsiW
MKPCSKNRELIVWLVLGDLENERATALRRHLETCEGCRRYLSEMAKLTSTVKATQPEPDVEATTSFHQRVVARVKTQGRVPARETLKEFLRTNLLNWRVALPAAGGLAAVLAIWVLISPAPFTRPPASSNATVNSGTKFDSNLQPTVANYQMVANQSLEKLDQLLNDQGRRSLPPVPVYTASTPPTASKLD